MAEALTAPAVLRAAAALGVIPREADVSREGVARWECQGPAYVGWISKDAAGALTWYVNIGDAKFGPLLEKYGRMSIPVRSSRNDIPWPQAVDSSLEGSFREGLGRAVRFVSDRAELCALLSSRQDVRRGDVFAWLPVANYPARLVLARDIGSTELESAIRAQLVPEVVFSRTGGPWTFWRRPGSGRAGIRRRLGFDIPF